MPRSVEQIDTELAVAGAVHNPPHETERQHQDWVDAVDRLLDERLRAKVLRPPSPRPSPPLPAPDGCTCATPGQPCTVHLHRTPPPPEPRCTCLNRRLINYIAACPLHRRDR